MAQLSGRPLGGPASDPQMHLMPLKSTLHLGTNARLSRKAANARMHVELRRCATVSTSTWSREHTHPPTMSWMLEAILQMHDHEPNIDAHCCWQRCGLARGGNLLGERGDTAGKA